MNAWLSLIGRIELGIRHFHGQSTQSCRSHTGLFEFLDATLIPVAGGHSLGIATSGPKPQKTLDCSSSSFHQVKAS